VRVAVMTIVTELRGRVSKNSKRRRWHGVLEVHAGRRWQLLHRRPPGRAPRTGPPARSPPRPLWAAAPLLLPTPLLLPPWPRWLRASLPTEPPPNPRLLPLPRACALGWREPTQPAARTPRAEVSNAHGLGRRGGGGGNRQPREKKEEDGAARRSDKASVLKHVASRASVKKGMSR
jgi:hypothetical protein